MCATHHVWQNVQDYERSVRTNNYHHGGATSRIRAASFPLVRRQNGALCYWLITVLLEVLHN